MAKNIQDLRREAGYRSAKEFAAAVGIAGSTYTRYESQPDAIPLRQAWAIADFLGCSIDMVVGREPVSAADMRGDVQKFYDGLSDEGREMMDGYMEYVSFKEEAEAKRRQDEEDRKYAVLLDYYESLFLKALSDDADYMSEVMYVNKPDIRGSFLEFLIHELERQRDGMAVRFAHGLIAEKKEKGTYYEGLKGLETSPDDPGYDDAYYRLAYERGAMLWEVNYGTIEGEVEKLMAAFDRAHRGGRDTHLQPMMLHTAVEYMGH